jgi:group I intron endonuclease
MINITSSSPIIGIYKITSPSNKIYVGQSINIEKRWKVYKHISCKKQVKLYNSLLKYKPENHIFELIEECSLEQLNEHEVYWKQHYINLLGWENMLFCELYDNSKGPRSEEVKNKIRESTKGRKINEEWRENIIKSSIGKKILWGDKISKSKKGCIYSEERNTKISKANKGKKGPIKSVIQYDLDNSIIKIHPSMKEAANFININHISGIQACCCGLQKTAHKYKWSYEEKINRNREKN